MNYDVYRQEQKVKNQNKLHPETALQYYSFGGKNPRDRNIGYNSFQSLMCTVYSINA
jgi:hypothetical protein